MEKGGKRILVIGGAGYIGSFTVAELCRQGYAVAVFDDLSMGHREAVVGAAQFIRGALESAEEVRRAIGEFQPDAVIHFAALASVPDSMRNQLLYVEKNIVNTARLLEVMQEQKVTRIVFSSTAATYGVPTGNINELHTQNPVNIYGATKLAVERHLAALASAGRIRPTVLRYFNACGAAPDGSLGEDHKPETHMIPNAVRAALGLSGPFTLFGTDYPTPDGTCVRDYVHVEDLATAHIAAVNQLLAEPDTSAACFRAFNIGTGQGVSNRAVIEAVERAVGKAVPLKIGPRREGDPPELVADPTKIKTELGWQPKYVQIDPIVKSVVAWFRRSPNGYLS